MFKKHVWLKLCILGFTAYLGFGVACNTDERGANDGNLPSENRTSKSNLPTITIDGVPLHVEIVQDAETRQKGLMHREELPEDQGMLFVFRTEHTLSFWMRNTFIPLDIAYISEDGIIVDIQRMEPVDDSKSYVSARPALYALEVNAGWFEKHGIGVGSKVVF